MVYPDLDQFRRLSKEGNLIPVYREILADMDTPVSAFRKIDDGKYSFLLESVEGGEKWARYSFLGSKPSIVVRSIGNCVEIVRHGKKETRSFLHDPLEAIKEILAEYKPVPNPGLPRFYGGAVGFIGYDVVRFFEKMPDRKKPGLGLPDILFMITDTLVIFDNVTHKIKVVSNAHITNSSPAAAYKEAV
ncbi:MAG TPA: anthranilate synthase component I, partial [Thermodesulfovibrionales bacterium]|nr:anthranilate synthase component I [Thermodesulfovibrionales bacterium]